MRAVFRDRTFSYALLRTMGHAAYGGADVGECLSTAGRIRGGDFDGWHREWTHTAERSAKLADEALAAGHRRTACEAYLRASNYHRNAEFFLPRGADPRWLQAFRQSRRCFAAALPLLDTPAEQVSIPVGDLRLPGYFYRPEPSREPRPTVIINGGFDATGEELYFWAAAAALRRGYNVLTFDGPGQGATLREQGLTFRPDWENVLSPVVDFALARREVDAARLALVGLSFGAVLGGRAAAFEPRLSAFVAFNGMLDMQAAIAAGIPSFVARGLARPRGRLLDALVLLVARTSAGRRWALTNGLWTFGASSAREWFHKASRYTVADVASRIRCPTLVLSAEDDHLHRGQEAGYFEALTCPKHRVRFTAEEGAGEHCQAGALTLCHARMFDWLDQTLASSIVRRGHVSGHPVAVEARLE